MTSEHNPWREFIENCIGGDNYFRASEYRELLADLDRLYAKADLAAQPPGLTEGEREWKEICSRVEDDIATGNATASFVFTKMRSAGQIALRRLAAPVPLAQQLADSQVPIPADMQGFDESMLDDAPVQSPPAEQESQK